MSSPVTLKLHFLREAPNKATHPSLCGQHKLGWVKSVLALKLWKELYQLFHISPAVDDSAHLHCITDHHIENGKVFYLYGIIWVFSLPAGGVWRKGLRTAQPLIDGLLHFINESFSGDRIP